MNKITLLVILVSVSSAYAGPSGKEIMTKNEDNRKLSTINSSATLTTGGGSSGEKIKEFTWWRKLLADTIHYNTLTRFHSPAEVRGEGILFLEHNDGENDVMLYLPSFKKIRRVESQAQSGSFMGSEFSYSDIATPHVDDYTYSVSSDVKCPQAEAASEMCFVVESTPVNDKIKERTGYSKAVTWLRHDNYIGVKAEYYDFDGKLFKRLEASEIKEVDTAKHKWLAHKVHMNNLKNGRYTDLHFANVKSNQPIQDSTFTQQNLESGR